MLNQNFITHKFRVRNITGHKSLIQVLKIHIYINNNGYKSIKLMPFLIFVRKESTTRFKT